MTFKSRKIIYKLIFPKIKIIFCEIVHGFPSLAGSES